MKASDWDKVVFFIALMGGVFVLGMDVAGITTIINCGG